MKTKVLSLIFLGFLFSSLVKTSENSDVFPSPDVIVTLTKEKILSLLTKALEHEDLSVRLSAVCTLPSVAEKITKKIPFFIAKALDDEDSDVRYYAIRHLHYIAPRDGSFAPYSYIMEKIDPEDALFVLKKALKDDDSSIRSRALETLVFSLFEEKIDEKEALPLIITALDDEDVSVQSEAVEALSSLVKKNGVKALPVFAQALNHSHHQYVRLRAAEALPAFLKKIDEKIILPYVKESFKTEEDMIIRLTLAMALPSFPKEKALAVFREAVNDKEWRVRSAALQLFLPSLGEQLPKEETLHLIKQLISDNENSSARFSGLEALSFVAKNLGEEKTQALFLEGFRSEDPLLRTASLQVFPLFKEHFSQEETLSFLIEALDLGLDSDQRQFVSVISPLPSFAGEISQNEGLREKTFLFLQKALDHKDSFVRFTASETLSHLMEALDAEKTLTLVEMILNNEKVENSDGFDADPVYAIDALVFLQEVIGREKLAARLVLLMSHKNPSIRYLALYRYLKYFSQEADPDEIFDLVTRSLNDTDPDVRLAVVAAFPSLAETLADKMPLLLKQVWSQENPHYVRSRFIRDLPLFVEELGREKVLDLIKLSMSERDVFYHAMSAYRDMMFAEKNQ